MRHLIRFGVLTALVLVIAACNQDSDPSSPALEEEGGEVDVSLDDEIGNAYDNTVLYTDYFLAQTIELLKQNSEQFEAAMIYMSDHGESLGEYGVYLHGMPYSLSPDNQRHIANLFWFGESFQLDRRAFQEKTDLDLSQDNLFHTLLGLMRIETSVYDANLDLVPREAWFSQVRDLNDR